MKIRLRVNPKLTKDELIQRLPAMAKAIAEAILEKGVSVSASIEGQNKSHPVRAIAAAEDEVYDQGSDALAGIYSWLLRKLKVDVQKGGDVSEEDFRHEMLERFGVKLGGSVDHKQACEIARVLSMFPEDVMEDRVETISVDGRFGTSKKNYPNHGRYYEDSKRIVLNPHIFGEDTDYETDSGEKIEKVMHTLVHEIAHSIDDKHGLSNKKEWRALSGWRYIGDREPNEGEDRMLLKEGDVVTLKGKWAHKKDAAFPRWYGGRNPKEDFCEAFAFAFLGAHKRFKGQDGEAKLAFVQKVIGDLNKSFMPGMELEAESIVDMAKSQGFMDYVNRRAASLEGDDQEVVHKAAAEFFFEECDSLFFEKAERGSGDTPAPSSTPAPVAAAPADAAAPNAQKGQQKPGHKYIKRETLPNGKYRYWYQMPTGEVYFSDDKELHDPAQHKEQMPSDTHFGNWKARVPAHQMLNEAPAGIEPHFFDEKEVPKLVQDIKPHDAQFDPKANPADREEAQQKAEESKVEPGKKPKRDQVDLTLKVDDADKITAAQKTWAIASIDPEFHSPDERQGINVALRVQIENDGEALLKPEAASALQHGNVRSDMNEMSTVFREALAYNIDKALGWNLVPPTSIRKLKGVGNRLVAKAMESFDKQKKAINMLKSKVHDFASMQFFAKGAKALQRRYEGEVPGVRKWADNVAKAELIRGAIFDMIINHQDRHALNIMFAPDVDSEKRYGGTHRLVLIDNGYSFGNGQNHRSDFLEGKARGFSGEFLDQKTLRDLRTLRDDLHNKTRRRKIVDDDIRKHVPMDQIIRVAHRIDFILSDDNRDAKGRVRMPDWSAMRSWEAKKYPAKYDGEVSDNVKNAFDATGNTNLLNFHDKRNVGRGKEPKIPQFKGESEIKDFLHPLLPMLNERQKGFVQSLIKSHGKDRFALHDALRDLASRLPKKLVDQMFVRQRFAERLTGIDENVKKNVEAYVMKALNRDYVGEFEDILREKGGVAAVEKHRSGEMKEAEIMELVGDSAFRRAQDRWVVHPKLRGLPENLTESIFNDPAKLGWHEPKAKKGDKEFWHQEEGEGNPNWQGGKQFPRGGHPTEKPKAEEVPVQKNKIPAQGQGKEGGDENPVEGVQKLKVRKPRKRGGTVNRRWGGMNGPMIRGNVDKSQGEPELLVSLEN